MKYKCQFIYAYVYITNRPGFRSYYDIYGTICDIDRNEISPFHVSRVNTINATYSVICNIYLIIPYRISASISNPFSNTALNFNTKSYCSRTCSSSVEYSQSWLTIYLIKKRSDVMTFVLYKLLFYFTMIRKKQVNNLYKSCYLVPMFAFVWKEIWVPRGSQSVRHNEYVTFGW